MAVDKYVGMNKPHMLMDVHPLSEEPMAEIGRIVGGYRKEEPNDD